ncbi:sigma 54-interacting transcriptional regulator [Blattabacterium cuenoti]|uniref:sigma 54-interacting transcriptional regulator n=1 Tax=Blattabacterium cuenoti TaxID=1653831 RepID=UPI00163C4536|nr:sigma-54 dependent transcriptional regulator [Blattabacterium cuenoti]
MEHIIQNIKRKLNIIGNDYVLHRALKKSIQVAPTDISVLVLGESGVGKEFIPKIIHQFSYRKHSPYISINCGAIPEGTIDSELFGHEKGSFTGANKMRKGYFEEANGGTIFLDEVGELPISTQIRLLRILDSGEFIKVGSSKIQKTNIRIIAATNLNMQNSIQNGKFREDLYYRLNTVEITIPALRFRKNDIRLLIKKFAHDFSERYNMPFIQFTEESIQYLEEYPWPGNIRQLKNVIEQISVVEIKRKIFLDKLKEYLPNNIPSITHSPQSHYENIFSNFSNNEKDFLYQLLFDIKSNLNNLKKLIFQWIKKDDIFLKKNKHLIETIFGNIFHSSISEKKYDSIYQLINSSSSSSLSKNNITVKNNELNSFSLQHKEVEFIQKALIKHRGKRKQAAKDLGISERTLYRKIKQYGL